MMESADRTGLRSGIALEETNPGGKNVRRPSNPHDLLDVIGISWNILSNKLIFLALSDNGTRLP